MFIYTCIKHIHHNQYIYNKMHIYILLTSSQYTIWTHIIHLLTSLHSLANGPL
jgi:hypothetical protein